MLHDGHEDRLLALRVREGLPSSAVAVNIDQAGQER